MNYKTMILLASMVLTTCSVRVQQETSIEHHALVTTSTQSTVSDVDASTTDTGKLTVGELINAFGLDVLDAGA